VWKSISGKNRSIKIPQNKFNSMPSFGTNYHSDVQGSKLLMYVAFNLSYNDFVLYCTRQPGPGAVREKFHTFFVKQSFFSSDLLSFWSLGYSRVTGSGWWGPTFPESVERSVQNLVEIYGHSRVKEGHRYIGTNSLFFIHIYRL